MQIQAQVMVAHVQYIHYAPVLSNQAYLVKYLHTYVTTYADYAHIRQWGHDPVLGLINSNKDLSEVDKLLTPPTGRSSF